MLLQPISTHMFVSESSFFVSIPRFFERSWFYIPLLMKLILYTLGFFDEKTDPDYSLLMKHPVFLCFNPLFVEPERHACCRFRGHLGQHLAFGGPFLLLLFPWQWRESLCKNLDFGQDMAEIDFLGGEFRIISLAASDDSDWIFVHC